MFLKNIKFGEYSLMWKGYYLNPQVSNEKKLINTHSYAIPLSIVAKCVTESETGGCTNCSFKTVLYLYKIWTSQQRGTLQTIYFDNHPLDKKHNSNYEKNELDTFSSRKSGFGWRG